MLGIRHNVQIMCSDEQTNHIIVDCALIMSQIIEVNYHNAGVIIYAQHCNDAAAVVSCCQRAH